MSKYITISIPDDLAAEFDEVVASYDVPINISALMRSWMADWVKQQKQARGDKVSGS